MKGIKTDLLVSFAYRSISVSDPARQVGDSPLGKKLT